GWSADEAIGRGIRQLLPLEELLDETSRILSRVCAGETVSGETLNRSKDGRVFPIAYTLSPIYAQDEAITGIVGIANDISPRKRAEEELERLRSGFLAMVTHGLRTPLTAIKGAAAVGMKEGSLSGTEAQDLFQVVNEQADRLHEMIGNLLDMSRIEAGSMAVRTEPSDAQHLLEEAVNLFNRSGGRNPVTIRTSGKLPKVNADRQWIIQVMTNLLSNATKFSPPGAPIIVEAEQQELQLAIHIRDSGMGIPPDKLGDLFKRFSQVHEQGIWGQGAGLGLAVCKGIIEAHGGRIWAESGGLGQGSTFSFTLPTAVSVETVPPPPPQSPLRRDEGKRILAVDDDPQVLRYLERLLKDGGYQVLTAAEASQVPRLIEVEQPDLVLLDLMLPGASGFDVLERIREFSEAPVIFLTARSQQEDMVRALKMGADDYITKPFAPAELQARIEVALRRHTTEQPPEQRQPFVLDDLVVNFAERRVIVGNSEVSLSATEYKLLYELASNPGRILTHDQLLQRVWGPEYSGETELIRSFIRNVRRKLGDDAANPRFIQTERQVGYFMRNP
ncbi:MAG: response regulator, partial [Chloroflexi bacterium]|nr:response regulator [Chloroflexota bacterium]